MKNILCKNMQAVEKNISTLEKGDVIILREKENINIFNSLTPEEFQQSQRILQKLKTLERHIGIKVELFKLSNPVRLEVTKL